MNPRALFPLLAALALLGAAGCSSSDAKATPAEEKAFAGGPPPANYMDAANKSAQSAQSAAQAKSGAPSTP